MGASKFLDTWSSLYLYLLDCKAFAFFVVNRWYLLQLVRVSLAFPNQKTGKSARLLRCIYANYKYQLLQAIIVNKYPISHGTSETKSRIESSKVLWEYTSALSRVLHVSLPRRTYSLLSAIEHVVEAWTSTAIIKALLKQDVALICTGFQNMQLHGVKFRGKRGGFGGGTILETRFLSSYTKVVGIRHE